MINSRVEISGTIKPRRLRFSTQTQRRSANLSIHIATPTLTPQSRPKLPRPNFWKMFRFFFVLLFVLKPLKPRP